MLSVGGNDALGHVGTLDEPVRSSRETIERLTEVREGFSDRYRGLIAALVGKRLPTAVCTIYEGNIGIPWQQRLAATALTVFNDAILRTAIEAGLPVIDLRSICSAPEHYANPIEPSAAGGERIARDREARDDARFRDRTHDGLPVIHAAFLANRKPR